MSLVGLKVNHNSYPVYKEEAERRGLEVFPERDINNIIVVVDPGTPKSATLYYITSRYFNQAYKWLEPADETKFVPVEKLNLEPEEVDISG